VGLGQVGAWKVGLGQVGAGKVRLGQVGAGKVGLGQEVATLRCLVRESNMVFVGSIEELFAPLRESSPPPPQPWTHAHFLLPDKKVQWILYFFYLSLASSGFLQCKKNQSGLSGVVKCRNEWLS
jgi:hypothetical protein